MVRIRSSEVKYVVLTYWLMFVAIGMWIVKR